MIGSGKIADIVMVARGGQVRCIRTGFEIFMQDILIQPAGHTFATKQRQISLDIKCTGLSSHSHLKKKASILKKEKTNTLRQQGEGGHCPKI